jgi:hypothetical protein
MEQETEEAMPMRGRGESAVCVQRERGGERERDVCNGFGSWSRRLAGSCAEASALPLFFLAGSAARFQNSAEFIKI